MLYESTHRSDQLCIVHCVTKFADATSVYGGPNEVKIDMEVKIGCEAIIFCDSELFFVNSWLTTLPIFICPFLVANTNTKCICGECPCSGEWDNQGDYMSCVAKALNTCNIPNEQQGKVISSTAQDGYGKHIAYLDSIVLTTLEYLQ